MSRLAAILLLLAGCSGASLPDGQTIEVEGTVAVRGNEPFSAPVLVTDDRNHYVLVLNPSDRAALVTPGRYTVVGAVFVESWAGRPFAHLRVRALERSN